MLTDTGLVPICRHVVAHPSPAIERDGIRLSSGGRNNLPVLLMSASLVSARQKDRVSHGNGGTDQEGMLVRGLVERRGFLRSVFRQ